MNETFKEYVTGTSFALQLSRKMCLALLVERQGGAERHRLNIGTYHSLEDRGLVTWKINTEGKREFGGLTKEGYLVAELLELAGMTVEGLTPVSQRHV